MSPSIAAVVVHHRHFPEVLETVGSLLGAGVPPERLVLVDNSEDPTIAEGLAAAAAIGGWRLHVVSNQGYGAAVNAARPLLPASDAVLVVTHEVSIDAPSVEALCDAVGEASVGAAGPALLLADGHVWSRGGRLTTRLRLPKQVVDAVPTSGPIRDVDWLDGACVLYRSAVLAANPFREDFFMYFEETELHARLRSHGWRVVAVEGAKAHQRTGGMPTYWGCRNVVLFQRAHGSGWSRLVAPPYFAARMMAISALQRDWASVAAAPKGLVAGYRAGDPAREGAA